MLRYIGNRLLMSVPVVLGVSVIVFLMLHFVPGDPVVVMLGDSPVSRERMESLRQELGLNDPIVVQYGRYLGNAVQGDLGRSIRTNRPVVQEIGERLPSTIQLAVAAVVLAVVIGVTMGVTSALFRNTWIDTLCTALALTGVSLPVFWLGLMLIFLFALRLGWFPATGQGGLKRLVLPAFTLGWMSAGIISRLTRSSMLEVIRAEYVVSARGKGLGEWAVLLRHALPNAVIPVMTVVGLQFGNLLAGTVITETVFARQGVGRLIVEGILQKDFPVVQGAVLCTAVMYATANLLVDISYAVVDPRVREEMR